MKAKRSKSGATSSEGLLVNVARTIGSALGTVAAEAEKFTRESPSRTRTRTRTRKSRTKSKGTKTRRTRATRNV